MAYTYALFANIPAEKQNEHSDDFRLLRGGLSSDNFVSANLFYIVSGGVSRSNRNYPRLSVLGAVYYCSGEILPYRGGGLFFLRFDSIT